jgi:hypothetical protein
MEIDLLKEYPLCVRYNKGGELFLLFWSTHNDGTHVIAAKNEASIQSSWKSVIKMINCLPTIKGYWKANLVSPTLELQQANAAERFQEEMACFRAMFGFDLAEYMEESIHDGKRPETVGVCTEYKPSDDITEEEDPDHYACTNCLQKKWMVKGQTVESLFLLHGFKVGSKYKRVCYSCKNGLCHSHTKISQAPDADPSKDIYYLDASSFGPHSGGLQVNKADGNRLLNNVLFFFQGSELVVPQAITDSLQEQASFLANLKLSNKKFYVLKENTRKQELNQRVEFVLSSLKSVAKTDDAFKAFLATQKKEE